MPPAMLRRASLAAVAGDPSIDSMEASVIAAILLLLDPRHLHPVGEVGGDAVGRAVLGQRRDRLIDPGLVPADDDAAAAARDETGGRVASIPLPPRATTSLQPAKVAVMSGVPFC